MERTSDTLGFDEENQSDNDIYHLMVGTPSPLTADYFLMISAPMECSCRFSIENPSSPRLF